MSDQQKIILAIANSLTVVPQDIMIVKLRTILSMLESIPYYSQTEAILAAFGEKEATDA